MQETFHKIPSFFGSQETFRFEVDLFECEVEGEVPAGLEGRLFRLGPDRQFPSLADDNVINGDGVISRFDIANGHVSYSCRYVKTARMLAERSARRRLYGKYRNEFSDNAAAPQIERDNTANTYAFYHHGRLFALREDAHPHEIDMDTLDTLPIHRFDGALTSLSLCAHPKIDPETGEWWSFGLFSKRRFDGDMALQVIDKDGNLIRQEDFQSPYPGLAHDFAVTREHVVFAVMPLTVDLGRLRTGGDFYRYDPKLPSMWGVMPRNGTTAEIRWFSAGKAFSGHIMNAFTEGSKVHVDATISPGNGFPFYKDVDGNVTPAEDAIATVSRVTFDLGAQDGDVTITPFPGAVGEMPKCDDRYAMTKYRYGYMMGPQGLMRLDWETLERKVYPLQLPSMGQEPVFVPRTADCPEGDGYILSLVNHPQVNRSELVILDANTMTALAKVKLPFNQPLAFHGCWVGR